MYPQNPRRPVPVPTETRTRKRGYGFQRVRVRVTLRYPRVTRAIPYSRGVQKKKVASKVAGCTHSRKCGMNERIRPDNLLRAQEYALKEKLAEELAAKQALDSELAGNLAALKLAIKVTNVTTKVLAAEESTLSKSTPKGLTTKLAALHL